MLTNQFIKYHTMVATFFTLIKSYIIITLLNIVYNIARKIKIYFSSFWLIRIITCIQEQLFLEIYF